MQATHEKGLWRYKDWSCEHCGNLTTNFVKILDEYGVSMPLEPPTCCDHNMVAHYPKKSKLAAPMVMRDINPYLSVAADKETGKPEYITSRSQHQNFLKRNEYEEIGNEKLGSFEPKKFKTTPDHIREAIEVVKQRVG
jgi:hypothetical protein